MEGFGPNGNGYWGTLFDREALLAMPTKHPRARSYRDLIVWQRARELTRVSYELTQQFPDTERYGLTTQVRRAAVSVSVNIAEGWGRGTRAELRRFAAISRGSLYELEAEYDVAEDLSFLTKEALGPARKAIDEISRMLTGLRKSLSQRISNRV
jgi:four helix bundle protein